MRTTKICATCAFALPLLKDGRVYTICQKAIDLGRINDAQLAGEMRKADCANGALWQARA